MSRLLLTLLLAAATLQTLRADEGMWLPTQFGGREAAMRGLGLKADSKAFQNASQAVVRFGEGCTASFVSDGGLLLTNYHCAYQAVAQHSTSERNLVESGYWAGGGVPELPVRGLSITIDRVVRDVTQEVSAAVAKGAQVFEAMRRIAADETSRTPQYRWIVRDYQAGKRFVLYGSEVFSDVRLVGVLPQSVAKFGGETDNYIWPRHNPDFAFFRVYVSPKGKPAEYAAENVPYRPANYLQVSTEGYDEGAFAVSMGYPMRTSRSATAIDIWRTRYVNNAPIVDIRGRLLEELQQRMRADRNVNLTYYEDFHAQANEYKNFLGTNEWIDRQELIAGKQKFERGLVDWARRENRYPGAERYLASQANADSVEVRVINCFLEGFQRGSRIVNFAMAFGGGLNTLQKGGTNTGMSRKDYLYNVGYYYRRMIPEVERQMTTLGMKLVRQSVPAELLPTFYTEQVDRLYGGDIGRFVDSLYARSIFADSVKIRRWLDAPWCAYADDPLVKVCSSIEEASRKLYRQANAKHAPVDRKAVNDYQLARIDYLGGDYYADADRTQRFSYGRVRSLDTRGYQTFFSGIAAKDRGQNPDYSRTERLQALGKECGKGALEDVPACFITDGDVTGGNSGSPMLDAQLRLIGLVCDCNWESMTRDYTYSAELHRVITVDIRLILMLVEQYGDARALVAEMKNSN